MLRYFLLGLGVTAILSLLGVSWPMSLVAVMAIVVAFHRDGEGRK